MVDVIKYYKITKFYDVLDKKIICRLCPNNCIIKSGKAGLCATRINIKEKFYSVVYGHPCSLHIDPVEKKPLYHFYPGADILSFGTYGCNLSCKGCQNFDITRVSAIKEVDGLQYYSPDEIIQIAIKNNVKLIAYTYNEPTIFFEYMIDVAKLAKKNGIKNVIVSNGYINPGPLKELCKYIDAANIDLKGITENFYKQYSKVDIGHILKTIKTIHKSKVWLELTNLIIPGLNDDSKDIHKLCTWIKENVGTDVPLHFSRFYPHYHASNIYPTPTAMLEKAMNIAKNIGLNYVYIGNLGFLDNTFCHECNTELISRNYSGIKIKMSGKDKNQCPECGFILPGIYQ